MEGNVDLFWEGQAVLKTEVNRGEIISRARYQTDSPEMLLVCPLSAINLSLSLLCSQSSLYLHTWPLCEKYGMLFFFIIVFFRQGFNHHLSITSAACRQTHTHKHTVPHQDRVETTTSADEKNKKKRYSTKHIKGKSDMHDKVFGANASKES